MPHAPQTGTPGGQGDGRVPVCEMTGNPYTAGIAMRSDTTQLDMYRDSPESLARAYRTAAETELHTPYYTDAERVARHDHYLREAEKLETA